MGTTVTVDAALLGSWSRAAADAMAGASAELDALNVFPVPDGDTGTNLLLTLAEAADGVAGLLGAASGPGRAVPVRAAARALLRGALVGARGNSGVILSQYLRGLLAGLRVPADALAATLDAADVAAALRSAAESAYAAVGRPVEGTVLTVARAVAEGAAAAVDGSRGSPPVQAPVDALAAGLLAGHDALAVTPSQLPALRRAGVLDAGGAGLLVVLGTLLEALDPGRPAPARTVLARATAAPAACGPAADATAGTGPHGVPADPDASPDDLRDQHGGEFEVMFVVSAVDAARAAAAPDDAVADDGTADDATADDATADDATAAALRVALGEVGDSVAVVGGDGLWQAHVHTDDPVAALGVAAAPDPGQVRVRHLASQAGVHGAHRPLVGVVAVTRATGLVADLARAGAVVVLVPGSGAAGGELRRAVEDTGAERVVVLGVAGAVTGVPTGRGVPGEPRVLVLDDLDEVQVVAGAATLATLAGSSSGTVAAEAVGEKADEVVDELVSAVRRVRTAHVAAAVGATGHAGHMGTDAVVTSARTLLADAGAAASVLTVLTGRDVPGAVADAVVAGVRAEHPAVDVVVLGTGTPGADVALGAE